MNENIFSTMDSNKVKIPDGFPELMMIVTREVLRNPPETELDAYSYVADYLEDTLLGVGRKDDLNNLMIKINKPNVDIYLERLGRAGYSINELNKLARIIQRGWKRYKSIIPKETMGIEWTPDELLSRGISLKSANESVIKIQRAWRKYRKSILKYAADIRRTYNESLEEYNSEYDSDDMERVNVVKKSQKDYVPYVPPIPDFIDDSNLFKFHNSMTNINKKIFFEDEDEYEDSIN